MNIPWWCDKSVMEADINSEFIEVEKYNFGGSSKKYLIKIPNGHLYIFKIYNRKDTFKLIADVLSYNLGKKIKDISIPVIKTEIKINKKKKVGSLQPLVPGAILKDYRKLDETLSDLSDKDIIDLCKEQVFDWIISNHDAHGNQFIRKDGTLLGIDKSQAMKYFDQDILGYMGLDFYHPNRNLEDYPIYKYIFTAIKNKNRIIDAKKITNEVSVVIERIENLNIDEFMGYYVDYFYEYRSSKFKEGKSIESIERDIANIKSKLIDRKNNMRNDFVKYYRNMFDDLTIDI